MEGEVMHSSGPAMTEEARMDIEQKKLSKIATPLWNKTSWRNIFVRKAVC